MIKNIFISRSLKSDSSFCEFEKIGFELYDSSLLNFSSIPFEKPNTDWIFFYSKKGIDFYFDQEDFDHNQKYAVMGDSSANHFNNKTGLYVDYIGDNSGENIANYLDNNLEGKSITFIKATNSEGSIERHIKNEKISFSGLVVYLNTIKTAKEVNALSIPNCDLIILTSPMNAVAWFDNFPYSGEPIYAIGQTTAQRIKTLIGEDVQFCKSPSETALYNLVRADLLKKIPNTFKK